MLRVDDASLPLSCLMRSLTKSARLLVALLLLVGCGTRQSEEDVAGTQQSFEGAQDSLMTYGESWRAQRDSLIAIAEKWEASIMSGSIPRTVSEVEMERFFVEFPEQAAGYTLLNGWQTDFDLNGDGLNDAVFDFGCGQHACSSLIYVRDVSGGYVFLGGSISSTRNYPIVCPEEGGTAITIQLNGRFDGEAVKHRVSFSGIEYLETTTYRIDYPVDPGPAVFYFDKGGFLPEGCSVD